MSKKRIKQPNCLNCKTPLPTEENFCPNCGQENHSLQSPISFLLNELVAGVFNLDSRLYKTITALIRQPGNITKAYNAGKRKAFVPPLRLYLFASVVFFLLVGLTTRKQTENLSESIDKQLDGQSNSDTIYLNILSKSFALSIDEVKQIKNYNNTQLDSFMILKTGSSSVADRIMLKQGSRILEGEATNFVDNLYKDISVAMFFLMPVFAALLYLIYRRRNYYYIEHLIFSLHFHSAVFLILALSQITQYFALHFLIPILFYLIICGYLLYSLKNVYQQTWIKTIGKFMILLIGYSVVTSFTLVISTFITLLFF